MIEINIKGDMKKARRHLSRIQQKQIPFATSLALNKTASDIREFEKRRMQSDLEQPTKTTINSVRMKPAKKHDLEAAVFILPAVSRFLRYSIEGGQRSPRGRVEAIPRDIRLNKYGNIPGRRQRKLARLLQRADTFEGKRGNVVGIWQRKKGNKLSLLVEYKTQRINYRARFPFYRYARLMASRVWSRHFRASIRRALNTAR